MFSMQLKYTGFPPKKSQWNAALKDTLFDVAAEWHHQYFEGHFTQAGARKYGYIARKGELLAPGSKAFLRSYVGRKLRKTGQNRPLYFSGEAYRESKVPKIRGTRKESRVVLSRKFNFKHPKSRIVMRDEVTRVLPAEANYLRRFAGKRLNERLQKFRDTQTTTK
jgi:hypothetical protein